jgi:rubrerythrin
MEGGMNAWEGLVAEGAPDAGMVYFHGSENPEELLALAWILEDGSGKFYTALSDVFEDKDAQYLFQNLSVAEEHHKESLLTVYRQVAGRDPVNGFPGDIISTEDTGNVMEGGMRVSEGIDWVKSHNLNSALELCMSNETNSYDLYIKMTRHVKDKNSLRIFETLVREEKAHLEKLTDLLEKKM